MVVVFLVPEDRVTELPLILPGEGPLLRRVADLFVAVEADELLDVVLDGHLMLFQELFHSPVDALHEDVLRPGDWLLLDRFGDGLSNRFRQLVRKLIWECLGDRDASEEGFEFAGRAEVDSRRAQEQPEDLLECDAPLKEAEAAEQRPLGRRQVRLIGVQQAGEPERLPVLLGRRELRCLGCPPRIAVEKPTDQAAEMVERQGMGPVRFDQLRQRRVVAADAVPAEQGQRRGKAEPLDVPVLVALSEECLQVGEGEPARDEGGRPADALGDPGQEPPEERVLDLPEKAGTGTEALLTLDALQAVEHQEVGTADHQGVAQEVEQARALGGHRGRVVAGEIAVGLLEEVADVGLLVEAPDEETLGTRWVSRPAQLVEKLGRDRGLAGAAEPHQRNHTPGPVPPRRAQFL